MRQIGNEMVGYLENTEANAVPRFPAKQWNSKNGAVIRYIKMVGKVCRSSCRRWVGYVATFSPSQGSTANTKTILSLFKVPNPQFEGDTMQPMSVVSTPDQQDDDGLDKSVENEE
jgi:hypothetical protein